MIGLPLSSGFSCCSQEAKKLFRSRTSQRSKAELREAYDARELPRFVGYQEAFGELSRIIDGQVAEAANLSFPPLCFLLMMESWRSGLRPSLTFML